MKKQQKSAAVLTIHRASEMTPKGLREIGAWLIRQRAILIKDAKLLSKRYTARYLYR